MNLKEAFRYQNELRKWMEEIYQYFWRKDNVTKVTEKHNRASVVPSAGEEEIVVETNGNKYDVNKVVQLAEDMLAEREKVGAAIRAAKAGATFDIDSAIAANVDRQKLAASFRELCKVKASETKRDGMGYTFNGEGNQVPYRYPVEVSVQIEFDSTDVLARSKALKKRADQVSTDVENLMVTTQLAGLEPRYDCNDSLVDLLDALCAKDAE
jgi:hypothetical protein